MSIFYEGIEKRSRGAWVVHHGQKTTATINGSAEFPALDTAGKAASLLSQLAATEQNVIEKPRLDALAKAAGLNPFIELPGLLDILHRQRLIDRSASGGVEALGLSTRITTQHAADIFESQQPTAEEKASITLAEITSDAPTRPDRLEEFISDEFKLTRGATADLLLRSETVGFVDAEGSGVDKLYFNGNLFRRDNVDKTKRVLDSLSDVDRAKVAELDNQLSSKGCVGLEHAEACLSKALFDKMKAAGMYDVSQVANQYGEFNFVTRPSAFHKFNDPLADDVFDLAKALVSALTYGMIQSNSGRGRISMIGTLLRTLIAGNRVGPATAIGEDYRILETKGVLHVTPAKPYGYYMKLRKRDVGEMALAVLTTGESSTSNVIDRPLPGMMLGYSGPERNRSDFRRKQIPASKAGTLDLLDALRTGAL